MTIHNIKLSNPQPGKTVLNGKDQDRWSPVKVIKNILPNVTALMQTKCNDISFVSLFD